MESSQLEINKTARLRENTFVKEGFTFAGWSEDPNAKEPTYQNQHSVYNLTTNLGNVVHLYAVWK